MNVDQRLWARRKKEFYRRMKEDKEIGYLDPGIEEVLEEFFARPKAFTTSSCSGRTVVIDAKYPWIRKGSEIVFRKHEPLVIDDLKRILSLEPVETYWLITSGPIIHVSCLDSKEAWEILRIGRLAGFKHSGISSYTKKGFLVELRTDMGFATPLMSSKGLIVNDLEKLVEISNNTIKEGRKRLNRLLRVLRENRPDSDEASY